MNDDAVADRLLAQVFGNAALPMAPTPEPIVLSDDTGAFSERIIAYVFVALSSGIVGCLVGASVATLTIIQRWGLGR